MLDSLGITGKRNVMTIEHNDLMELRDRLSTPHPTKRQTRSETVEDLTEVTIEQPPRREF